MNQQEQDDKLEDWLGRHKGLLLKVARSFDPESHDRDDLFQEMALQLWKSIPRYTGDVAESTWIYRVAFYTAISWHRKESKFRDHGRETMLESVIGDDTAVDPRVDWLYEKIAELDAIDRSLALLLLEGFSYREMSETLGMSQNNVGVRINRIKKQLTSKLQYERNYEL